MYYFSLLQDGIRRNVGGEKYNKCDFLFWWSMKYMLEMFVLSLKLIKKNYKVYYLKCIKSQTTQ